MLSQPHSHRFRGIAESYPGHTHQYWGITSTNLDVIGHTHRLEGRTAISDGHVHHYKVTTGAAIYIKNGHYHYYQCETRDTDHHSYMVSGFTSIFR